MLFRSVYFISKVLKHTKLEYLVNKINTPFYVYVYLSIIQKKKKNYKVLELGELEYLRNKINAPISTSAMPRWQN